MGLIAATRFRYFRNLVQLGILLPWFLLAGCGGGGGSNSGGGGGGDNGNEPTIDVSFPLPNSNLAGETDRITIRGRSVSSDGASVNQVLINNPTFAINLKDPPPDLDDSAIAKFDQADPSRWSAQIPLLRQSNEITIEAVDVRGRSRTVKLNVSNGPMLADPKGVVLDSANQRALVVDSILHALLAVDLDSGDASLISGLSTGAGPAFESPEDIALDRANNRALVMDWNLKALLSVDLDSGDRTIVSKNGVKGAGPAFDSAGGLSLDSANQRVLIVDIGLAALIEVDLESGDRTVISDENTGAGPAFFTPEAVDLDSANNRALVADSGLEALLEVDLNSGDRTMLPLISNETTTAGPVFVSPIAVALDSTNRRALVLELLDFIDDFLIALATVDLDSGDTTVISDQTIGTGPLFFSYAPALALDSDQNRVLVVDGKPGLSAFLAVDLDNGNRTEISNSSTGSGPAFNFPYDVAIDNDNQRALVVNRGIQDSFSGGLLAVELNGGRRTVISSNTTGAGPSFDLPEAVVLDSANHRALMVDDGANISAALLAVNLGSGDRTVISDETISTGPALVTPSSLVLDSKNNRVLTVDYNLVALVAVDLNNGRRTVISNNATGAGPEFKFPYGIALDSNNNLALVVDPDLNALLGVDLNTGSRTLISDKTTGTGPMFVSPSDVALDSNNNRALVVNSNALLAVDLDSGLRTVISNNTTGSGPEFDTPTDVAIDSDNQRALVVDNGLIVVDIISGDRAIVSQ
jgi:hypothetical protein